MSTLRHVLRVQHFIDIQNISGGVTQNEDDDDEQENDGVTPVLGTALPLVDGDEDADVETEKQNQWQYSQQQHSDPVLVDDDIVGMHPQLCDIDHC